MAELREVRILIGSRRYRMQTALDEDTLSRISALLAEVGSVIGGSASQDDVLALTCLQLSYSIDRMTQTLESLTGKLDRLEPFVADPDDEAVLF